MAVDRAFIVLFVLASSCFVIGEDELQTLDDSTFERLTQAATGATTGDWLVVFCKEKAPGFRKLENLFIKLNTKYKQKLNVAKVLSSSKLTVKRFEVTRWPSVILFHHGHQYYYTDSSFQEASISKFIEKFQTFPNRKVAEPITMFDVMIQDMMDDTKHIINLRKNAAIVIFCSGILFGCILMQVLKGISQLFQETDEENSKAKGENTKTKKDD